MNLNLDEKLLLRSLSDLIICDPQQANFLLDRMPLEKLPFSDELNGVLYLIQNYNPNEFESVNYYSDLEREIKKIHNDDIKDIFSSSLEFAQNNIAKT